MLSQAGHALGLEILVLDPTPESPAGQVADKQIVGDFTEYDAVMEFARDVDVVTFEIESANAEALAELEQEGKAVYPSGKTLSTIKDKVIQKAFLREQGLPVPAFRAIASAQELRSVADELGLPLMLKARRGGYDGRGNNVLESIDEIDEAVEYFGERSFYAEAWVPFVKELAINVTRGRDGEIVVHPVVETIHKNSICHIVHASADVSDSIRTCARELGKQIVERLGGVGCFGIELFLLTDGELLINEIAPRVHNSGHHTIESCAASQFEQHMRAVCGMELADAAMTAPAACMINILGDRRGAAEPRGIEAALQIPEVAVHIYGKVETKPERKMGHVTALGKTAEEAYERAWQARERITI